MALAPDIDRLIMACVCVSLQMILEILKVDYEFFEDILGGAPLLQRFFHDRFAGLSCSQVSRV